MSGHPFEFIFGGPPDPEQQAQMQRAHDQAVMSQQSLRHEVQSFVDDLNEDGLRVLRAIVHAAGGDENYGAFVQGALTTMLHIKFGMCAACGQNHEKELLGGTATPEASMPEIDDGTQQDELPFGDALDQYVLNMEEYNLRKPEEGEVDSRADERPVICRRCNSLYQSLGDRMLRPKGIDGCHGCQIKSAHG